MGRRWALPEPREAALPQKEPELEEAGWPWAGLGASTESEAETRAGTVPCLAQHPSSLRGLG